MNRKHILIFLCSLWLCEAEQSYSNIEVFSVGIDTFFFDPIGSSDPTETNWLGQQVFNIRYSNKSDIPDGVTIIPYNWCSSEAATTICSTFDQVQKYQSSQSGGGGGVKFFGFGADYSQSQSSKSAENSINQHKSILIYSCAKCVAYLIETDPTNLTLTEQFIQMVAKGPTDSTQFWKDVFIPLFKNAFPTRIWMGSQTTLQYTMMQDFWSKSSMTSEGAKKEGGFNFLGFVKADAKGGDSKNMTINQKFNSSIESTQLWFTGEYLQEDPSTWQKTTNENPQIISASFVSISSLLTSEYFPDDPSIDQKREMFQQAEKERCEEMEGCYVLPPADMPVWSSAEGDLTSSNQALHPGPEACGLQAVFKMPMDNSYLSTVITSNNLAIIRGSVIFNITSASILNVYPYKKNPSVVVFPWGDVVVSGIDAQGKSTLSIYDKYGSLNRTIDVGIDIQSLHLISPLDVNNPNTLYAVGKDSIMGTDSIMLLEIGSDNVTIARQYAGVSNATGLCTAPLFRVLFQDSTAITLLSGVQLTWSMPIYSTAGTLRLSPDGSIAFVVGPYLMAFDLRTSWQRWIILGIDNVLAVSASGQVFVTSTNGTTGDQTLFAIADMSGQVRWSLPVGGKVLSCAVGLDDTLYCLTSSKFLSISSMTSEVLWSYDIFPFATSGKVMVAQGRRLLVFVEKESTTTTSVFVLDGSAQTANECGGPL